MTLLDRITSMLRGWARVIEPGLPDDEVCDEGPEATSTSIKNV